jgi:hypothetical protein
LGLVIGTSVSTPVGTSGELNIANARWVGIVITAKTGSPTTLYLNVAADVSSAAVPAPNYGQLASGPIVVSSLPIAYALADDLKKFGGLILTVDTGTITADVSWET